MSGKQIRATGDHVLLEPVPPPRQSAGGIELPVAWQQPSGTGIVIAVGPGRVNRKGVRIAPPLSVGDKVTYSWIDGRHEMEVDGKQCVWLTWPELKGVMTNE